MHKNTVCSQCL